MSEPIGPGDWVICVDASPLGGEWPPSEEITEGALYQVADGFVAGDGVPVVELVGKDRSVGSAFWGERVGYRVSRFRPLLDGADEALIAELRTESPAPVSSLRMGKEGVK